MNSYKIRLKYMLANPKLYNFDSMDTKTIEWAIYIIDYIKKEREAMNKELKDYRDFKDRITDIANQLLKDQ